MSLTCKLPEIGVSGDDSVEGHLLFVKMVLNGLQNLKQGEAMDYRNIIEHLSVSPMKKDLMHKWLQALSLCVSNFSRNHDELINSSLTLMWYEDQVTANYYIEYLTSLLSAQTYYLCTVLMSLVQHFWVVPAVSGNSGAGDMVLENIHRAVQATLALIPTASSVLMPLLSKGFPFKRKSVETQELALRNVLHVTLYCPTLRDSILELVVHQMLAMDVELPNLEEEEDDEDVLSGDEGDLGAPFHVELDCDRSRLSLAKPASSLGLHFSKKQVMKNEQAEKLDVMMSVSFQHLHSVCHHKNGHLHYEASRNVLFSLIKIFESILLPTHACSSVQFLLFKLTSLHQDFPGFFLDFLWNKFQDPNTPAVLRQTAAAYIASYIARSRFVSLETTKLCLTVVAEWIHEYLDTVSLENMRPDVKQHGPFFSLCQALFYIFIFRQKHLLQSPEGSEFLRRLNFERIITSRLNPLKVCLPSVVEVFASLANRHEIAFCYSILEQNKRVVLISSSGSDGVGTKKHLDCLFPFDPYRLRRSGKFIQSLCQEWEDDDPTCIIQEDIYSSSLKQS